MIIILDMSIGALCSQPKVISKHHSQNNLRLSTGRTFVNDYFYTKNLS